MLKMQKQPSLLVVSARLENKKALLRILEDLAVNLPVNTITASTVAQAQEVLAQQPISVIFCEERLPDGPYHELLALATAKGTADPIQIIVMLCTGEWKAYLEALRLGAADVVRCPLRPTDVELALIHAVREETASQPPQTLRATA